VLLLLLLLALLIAGCQNHAHLGWIRAANKAINHLYCTIDILKLNKALISGLTSVQFDLHDAPIRLAQVHHLLLSHIWWEVAYVKDLCDGNDDTGSTDNASMEPKQSASSNRASSSSLCHTLEGGWLARKLSLFILIVCSCFVAGVRGRLAHALCRVISGVISAIDTTYTSC